MITISYAFSLYMNKDLNVALILQCCIIVRKLSVKSIFHMNELLVSMETIKKLYILSVLCISSIQKFLAFLDKIF